jgi:SAM-dependent methyltransferase
MPADPSSSRYLHGTEPREQARLSRLNDLLNAACLRELNLQDGESVLDLGSGLGQLTRAMARAVGPSGRVVGVERSDEQRTEALRQAREAGEEDLVDWRAGDAASPPLSSEEWGSFDVAHARYVLEHVHRPLEIVQVLVRSVRPGGRVILIDDDHEALQLWPEPAGLSGLWKAYIRTFDRNGNDPIIGRRLVSLLHEAGARPSRTNLIFFGGCSGQDEFPVLVENLIGLIEGVREPILAGGLLGEQEFDAGIEMLWDWRERPDAAFWFTAYCATGIRPSDS